MYCTGVWGYSYVDISMLWLSICSQEGIFYGGDYVGRMNLYISHFSDGVLFSYSTVYKKWPLTEEVGWWMAERNDFKRGYWSRVEIPTGCKSFFSLIFVYKLTSMNLYILWSLYQFVWFLYTNWLVRILTYYDVCTNSYIFMW